MDFYEDLPNELQPLFPQNDFPGFPEAIGQLLTEGWYAVKPNHRKEHTHAVHDKKGLVRVLYASNEAVKAPAENPPKDVMRL